MVGVERVDGGIAGRLDGERCGGVDDGERHLGQEEGSGWAGGIEKQAAVVQPFGAGHGNGDGGGEGCVLG